MYRGLVILSLLFASLQINAQEVSGFRYTDSLTYKMYVDRNWDELIVECRTAIDKGFDYYYLRMRIGIAFYEQHKYALSAIHFKKALEFNENDQVALEYLFYSYYLSGHQARAISILSFFYPQNRERIISESMFKKNTITVESFFSDAGTEKIIEEHDSYFSDTEPGNQIVTKYFLNNSISASHVLGDHLSYFHSYTLLIKDNYLNYSDGSGTAALNPQRIIQNQYFGSFNIFSAGGWIISPSFHLLKANYPLIFMASTGMNSSARSYYTSFAGFYSGLTLSKSFGFADLTLAGGYSDINHLKKAQGTLSLLIYPAGNSNFYFGGDITLAANLSTTNTNPEIVQGYLVGFSVAEKVWFEFSGLTGSLNNYIGKNGLYIFNSADMLNSRLSGRIIIPFPKRGFTLFTGGGVASYSSEIIKDDGTVVAGVNKINYNSINITGGLTWNF